MNYHFTNYITPVHRDIKDTILQLSRSDTTFFARIWKDHGTGEWKEKARSWSSENWNYNEVACNWQTSTYVTYKSIIKKCLFPKVVEAHQFRPIQKEKQE